MNEESELIAALLVVNEDISRSTVPIFTFKGDNMGRHGTGTFFKIGTKSFLLSAAHVLDYAGIFRQGLCVPAGEHAPATKIKWRRYVSSPIPKGREEKDISMRDDDPYDIGVLEVDDSTVSQLNGFWRFVTFQEMDFVSEIDSGIFGVFGYPNVLTTTDPEDAKHISDVGCHKSVSRIYAGIRDRREMSSNILLDFPMVGVSSQGEEIKAPEPKGISGSAIWRITKSNTMERGWNKKDLKFVGIQHRWRSELRYLVGTPILYALSLIHHNYEDLQLPMELVVEEKRVIVP